MEMTSTTATMSKRPSVNTAPVRDNREARLFASLDRSAFTKRHGWLYAVLTLTHVTDGFDLLMTGVVLPGIIAAFKLTAPEAGIFASSVFLGMTVGAVAITYLADHVGRKKAMLLCVTLYAAFSMIAAFAWDYQSIVTLRFLQGVGLGAEVPLVLTYLLEFMPVHRRGVLAAGAISLWQFAGLFAALVAMLIIPAFTWRGMFVVGAIPAFFLVIALAYLPESIRYLVHKKKMAEAEAIVRRFSSIDPDAIAVPTAEVKPRSEAGLRDILRGKYLRYTLGIWIMSITWAMAFFGLVVWLPSLLIRMGFTQVHSFAYTAAIVGAGATGLCPQWVVHGLSWPPAHHFDMLHLWWPQHDRLGLRDDVGEYSDLRDGDGVLWPGRRRRMHVHIHLRNLSNTVPSDRCWGQYGLAENWRDYRAVRTRVSDRCYRASLLLVRGPWNHPSNRRSRGCDPDVRDEGTNA
jgi:putative MFS transporter